MIRQHKLPEVQCLHHRYVLVIFYFDTVASKQNNAVMQCVQRKLEVIQYEAEMISSGCLFKAENSPVRNKGVVL